MIQGLLLSAGNSQRFGQCKLISELPNHLPIAIASALKLKSVINNLCCVVKPDDSELIRLFSSEKLSIIRCQENALGIGHSIVCGVSGTQDASGWVIALADMPFIKTSTIEGVVNALKDGALIAVPIYKGRRGHPVGFSSKLYSELTQLTGDQGARSLLQKYASKVVEIQCDDGGIHIDIDTPEDLERYSKEFFG